jgi:serine protease Do
MGNQFIFLKLLKIIKGEIFMKRAIIAATGLIGLGIVIGVLIISNINPGNISQIFAEESKNLGAKNAPIKMAPDATMLNNAMVSASEAVLPTVVSVSVIVEQKQSNRMREQFREFFRFFGEPEPDEDSEDAPTRRSEASGSGVIISSDGYIITNNHVVEDATELRITTHDRKEYKAELIGTDPLTDLAIIKIDAKDLKSAHFANIQDVKIGEFVLAVGNPLGLNSTVTSGIVSAIGRGGFNRYGKSPYSVENYIQTDAAINPGNSGGGLFNLSGSLVGINTAIATRNGTYIGYGFAIPIDLVHSVISDLMDDGKVDRGYIGVSIGSLNESMAKSVGLDAVKGVVVHDVIKGKAASRAGIESGDIILEVNGHEIMSSNELQGRIALYRAGDDVKLTLWRNGKKLNKTVTLESREEENTDDLADKKEEEEESDKDGPVAFDNLGFSVEPVDKDIKKSHDVKSGVVVSEIKRYGVAAENGLFPNGVIVKVDRKKVTSVKQFKKLIEDKEPGDAVLLQVKYPEANRMVALEIPKK